MLFFNCVTSHTHFLTHLCTGSRYWAAFCDCLQLKIEIKALDIYSEIGEQKCINSHYFIPIIRYLPLLVSRAPDQSSTSMLWRLKCFEAFRKVLQAYSSQISKKIRIYAYFPIFQGHSKLFSHLRCVRWRRGCQRKQIRHFSMQHDRNSIEDLVNRNSLQHLRYIT